MTTRILTLLCFAVVAYGQASATVPGILTLTIPGSDIPEFSAEKLTPTEISEVDQKRTALKKAEADLADSEKRIKESHGQRNSGINFSGTTYSVCYYGSYSKDVELRGDWALVTRVYSPGNCQASGLNIR